MKTAMRAVFITDGGSKIGLGHIRRCLALAQSLAARGAEVRFLVGPDAWLARLVKRAGFMVDEVAWYANSLVAVRALQTSGASVAVVDSNTATPELFNALHKRVERLVAVDDTADRPMPVDVVVNGGVGAESLIYRAARDTLLLLGPRYALIEPQYATPPSRLPAARVERILVTLGGSVQAAAAGAAIAAASAVVGDAVVDVILGPYGSTARNIHRIVDGAGCRLVIRGHVQKPQHLMRQADLAITGAGMTLYELAATAMPCVMVMTEPNQVRNVDGFQLAGAAVFGGSAVSPELRETLEEQLFRLVTDADLRTSLGAAARRLVDGEGTLRVACELGRAITAGN